MYSLCFLCVAKFTAIVRLYRFRSIAKVSNSSLHEIYGRITALLFVRIYKTLSRSLINHCVLVEFLSVFTGITSSGNYFNVKLPLNAENGRRVVFLVMLRLFLCRFYLFPKAKAHENAVKRSGIPCITKPRRTKTR